MIPNKAHIPGPGGRGPQGGGYGGGIKPTNPRGVKYTEPGPIPLWGGGLE